jgi:hypothetical protein
VVPEALQHLAVLAEIPLEGEYTNAAGSRAVCHLTPRSGPGEGVRLSNRFKRVRRRQAGFDPGGLIPV